jgi:hypothetical protein
MSSIQPGRKFGLLTVVKEVSPNIYECTCKCGNLLDVWRSLLAHNVQLDCRMCRVTPCQLGQRRRSCFHGHRRVWYDKKTVRKTRWKGTWKRRTRIKCWNSGELNSWSNMLARCTNVNHHAYADYGGRGIRVCERWSLPRGEGFKNFLDDMGPRPANTTLDRKNPQGHYEPTNCRWADKEVQSQNRRNVLWPKGGKIKMPSMESVRAMEARIQADFDEINPF